MSECIVFCEDTAHFVCVGWQYKNILSVAFSQKKFERHSSRELRTEPECGNPGHLLLSRLPKAG